MTDTAVRQTPSDTSTPPAERRRWFFVVAVFLFRILATVHAVLTMGQPVSIGRYLGGSYVMIRVHAEVAGVLVLVAAGLGVTAVLYAVAGGRVWAAAVCALFFFAEGVQTGMGYSRLLGVHIPLGVAIVTGALVIGVWSWTRSAGRPRIRRPGRVPDETDGGA